VLDVELSILRNHGITDVVISVGYYEEKIRDFIARNYPDLSVTFVRNTEFASTNCIYSMWLAREYLDDDLVFLTGDLVFDESVITKLLSAQGENVMYVNPEVSLPEKDFKARISPEGLITEIGVDVFGDDARFCWPLYRLSKKAVALWMAEIEKFIERGEKNVYAEVAFNNISEKIELRPAQITDFCTEVDDHDDLALAREHYEASPVSTSIV